MIGNDLFELQVYGLVVGQVGDRPLLLMKTKEGNDILPIPVSALEAQILASGSDRPEGPHGVSLQIFNKLGLKIEKAQFREVRSNRQILEFHCSSQAGAQVIESAADHSMSLALGAKAPVFASQNFIDQCRRSPLNFQMQSPMISGPKIPPHLLQ